MTLSPRAIEAAGREFRLHFGNHIELTADEIRTGIKEMITAYLAAIAVDGVCLVEANEVEKLRSALKGLSDMYTHAWDLADGGLMMMESSMDRFEKAHQVAYDVLNPDHPLISDEDDEDDVAAASTGDTPREDNKK